MLKNIGVIAHGKAVGRMEVIRELKAELERGKIPEVMK